MKAVTLALLLGSLAASGAWSQPVYRCGNAYSQVACPQGQVVDVADPRSAAQVADARRVAAADRRLAAEMEHDRLAEQLASAPRVVATRSRATRPVGPVGGSERRASKTTKARKDRSSELSDPIIIVPAPPKRRAHV